MANIKLKNNYWVTESIYDTTDSKTQKQVNADLHQDISDLNGALNAEIAERQTYVRPNLLDNWYFAGSGSQAGAGNFPINQRGYTTYSANGYCVDRWTFGNNAHYGTLEIPSSHDGIVISHPQSEGYSQLSQTIINWESIRGKIATVSAIVDSVLYSHTFTVGSTSLAINFGNLDLYTTTNGFLLRATAAKTAKILAVKFELGDTQTLAYQRNGAWILSEFPDYKEQMLRCISSSADTNDGYANCDTSFLQRQITSQIEPTANASVNYAKGRYLERTGTLYKTIATITAGSALTSGTNIKSTNVIDELLNTARITRYERTVAATQTIDVSEFKSGTAFAFLVAMREWRTSTTGFAAYIVHGIQNTNYQGVEVVAKGADGASVSINGNTLTVTWGSANTGGYVSIIPLMW